MIWKMRKSLLVFTTAILWRSIWISNMTVVIASPILPPSDKSLPQNTAARQLLDEGNLIQKNEVIEDSDDGGGDDVLVAMRMIAYVNCSSSSSGKNQQKSFSRNEIKKEDIELSSSFPCQAVLVHDDQNQAYIFNPGIKDEEITLIDTKQKTNEKILVNQTCSTVKEALQTMSKMASSSSSLFPFDWPWRKKEGKQKYNITRGEIKILPGSICRNEDNLNIGAAEAKDTSNFYDKDDTNNGLPPFPISLEGIGTSPKDVIFDCTAEEKQNDKNEAKTDADRAFIMSSNGINFISNLSIRNCEQLPIVTPSLGSSTDAEEQNYKGYGGAILILQNTTDSDDRTNITIEHVAFEKNQALIGGGAIAVMMKTSSKWQNNTTTLSSRLVMRNCRFEENYSHRTGGALHVHVFNTNKNEDNQQNNSATNVEELQTIWIENHDNTFNNNHARVHGGAISFIATSTKTSDDTHKTIITTTADFKECTFRNNHAQAGGAIHTMIAPSSMTHPFSSLTSTQDDGIVSSQHHSSSSFVWNGTFYKCNFGDNLARWRGGAVYSHSSLPSQAQSKKKASDGAPVSQTIMTLLNSTFTKNIAAGNASSSICSDDFNSNNNNREDDDDDDEYYENTCLEAEEGGAGGALYVENTEIGIFGCHFDSNQALDLSGYESLVANGARGGAVAALWTVSFFVTSSSWFQQSSRLMSKDSEFRSNSVVAGNAFERPAQGGAIWIEVSAGGPGGGHQFQTNDLGPQPKNRVEIHNGGDDHDSLSIAQFTNLLFYSNEATSEARTVSPSFGRRRTVGDNPISNKGGGVFISFSRGADYHFSKKTSTHQSTINFISTTFEKNAADFGGIGGGVYMEGGGQHSHLMLLNSSFYSNAAISTPYFPGAGGGVSIIGGSRFSIKGCNFTLNYASPHVNLNHHALVSSEDRLKHNGNLTAKTGVLELTSDFWKTLAGHTDGKFLLSSDAVESKNKRSSLHWSPDAESLSGEGGAIHLTYASSESSVESTIFDRNFCGSGDGGIDSGPKGGAVNIMSAANEHHKDNQLMPTPSCLTFNKVYFSKNAAIASNKAVSSQMIFLDGSSSGRGGAVHVNHAAPCFSKCVFQANTATAGRGERPALGGAVDLFLTSGNVPFLQCIFAHNSVAKPHRKDAVKESYREVNGVFGSLGKRRIYKSGKQGLSRGYLSMETGRGGAVAVIGSSISMNNCTIANNTAFESVDSPVASIGGGIYIDASSTGNLTYTTFHGNKAAGLGDDVCSINFRRADENPPSWKSDALNANDPRSKSNATLSMISCTFESGWTVPERSQAKRDMNTAKDTQYYSILLLGGNTILSNPSTSVFVSGSGEDIASLIDGEELPDEGIALSAASLHIVEESNVYPKDPQSRFSLRSQNASLSFTSSIDGTSTASLSGLVMIRSNLSSTVERIVVHDNVELIDVTLRAHEDLGASEFKVLGKAEIGKPVIQTNTKPGSRVDLFNINMTVSGVLQTNGVSFWLHGKAPSVIVSKKGSMLLTGPTTLQKAENILSVSPSSSENTVLVNNGIILHQDCDSLLTVTGGTVSQGKTGVTRIKLCDSVKWSGPIWSISPLDGSVGKFAGLSEINFSDKGAVREESSWILTRVSVANSTLTLLKNESQFFSNTSIQMPSGIRANISVVQVDNYSLEEILTIPRGGIACEQVMKYAENVTEEQSQCQFCLQSGTGCAWDNTLHSCSSSRLIKTSADSEIYRYSTENCCPLSCHERGNCVILEGSPSCSCSWLFSGKSCESLSPIGIIIIVFASVTFTLFVSFIGYSFLSQRSRSQAVYNTLEQLRQGLLESVDIECTESNEENGLDMKSEGLSQSYIKSLHEQLLLKDASVPMEEIIIEEDSIIGKGAFGLVYKGLWRGSAVAIKMVRREVVVAMGEESLESFKREAFIMSRLRHPNIALLMGISLPPSLDTLGSQHLYILTEYMNMGSLADVLSVVRQKQSDKIVLDDLEDNEQNVKRRILKELKSTEWNYELLLTCASQAARGMTYLHSRNPPICHRDLKASNLLVDNKWTVKVADFGLSRIVTDANASVSNETETPLITDDDRQESFSMELPMTSNMGTVAWAAPEMLAKESKTNYGLQVDVYSFGMVLWELYECKQPFSEMLSRFDIMDAVKKGVRPRISPSCPTLYKDLITKCVSQDPKMRPNFPFIVNRLERELERVNEAKARKEPSFPLTAAKSNRRPSV